MFGATVKPAGPISGTVKSAPKLTPTSPLKSTFGYDKVMGGDMMDAPKMHDGGVVPKTGVYTLEKGEKVVPAGRNSEYRKVYVARTQTRQGGGNTPVKGEKHPKKD